MRCSAFSPRKAIRSRARHSRCAWRRACARARAQAVGRQEVSGVREQDADPQGRLRVLHRLRPYRRVRLEPAQLRGSAWREPPSHALVHRVAREELEVAGAVRDMSVRRRHSHRERALHRHQAVAAHALARSPLGLLRAGGDRIRPHARGQRRLLAQSVAQVLDPRASQLAEPRERRRVRADADEVVHPRARALERRAKVRRRGKRPSRPAPSTCFLAVKRFPWRCVQRGRPCCAR